MAEVILGKGLHAIRDGRCIAIPSSCVLHRFKLRMNMVDEVKYFL